MNRDVATGLGRALEQADQDDQVWYSVPHYAGRPGWICLAVPIPGSSR